MSADFLKVDFDDVDVKHGEKMRRTEMIAVANHLLPPLGNPD
jgi:hypothetical protein